MDDVRLLRRAADYQFGAGAGSALFPDTAALTATRTSSGRPRQVSDQSGRLVTYGTDGRLRLGVAGGRRLQDALDSPRYRVVVGDESEPYVLEGRNVFAKFVTTVGDEIRPRDEVLVEHEDGRLLAVGRAELPARGMRAFETGMAVAVRDSADS
jgi:uncharacterized protein with predicted RNA binding PUA domain